MQKEYQTPEIELVKFETEDIITTSGITTMIMEEAHEVFDEFFDVPLDEQELSPVDTTEPGLDESHDQDVGGNEDVDAPAEDESGTDSGPSLGFGIIDEPHEVVIIEEPQEVEIPEPQQEVQIIEEPHEVEIFE